MQQAARAAESHGRELYRFPGGHHRVVVVAAMRGDGAGVRLKNRNGCVNDIIILLCSGYYNIIG